jgi:hypothetical protein
MANVRKRVGRVGRIRRELVVDGKARTVEGMRNFAEYVFIGWYLLGCENENIFPHPLPLHITRVFIWEEICCTRQGAVWSRDHCIFLTHVT